ncbi:MAG: hypothetical protein J6J36_07100 [Clostridia bacterium]|nr:hypothetical protein [Clostridia bacterium]
MKRSNSEATPAFGKFESANELYVSYINLEREYTKSRQELAEKERLLRKYAATSCPINQDKILFCIEQLEKVKANVNKTDENGYLIKFANLDERLKFYKEIDNQIEELKKGVE